MRGPELRGLPALRDAGADPAAIVLLLHGGGEQGHQSVSWRSTPVLRMLPFGWAAEGAARRAGESVAVVRLKYGQFGWNGPAASPVGDTRWALQALATIAPGIPVILVGHSMGGRAAAYAADAPNVGGVAALAPWVVSTDPVRAAAGLPYLILHGTLDERTSPERSRRYAARLRSEGVDATWHGIPGEGHAMIRAPWVWHRHVARFVAGIAGA